MKIKLAERLYIKKEEINILGSNKKTTNTAGPAGLGTSKHRPASVRSGVKYSGVGKVLDAIFVEKRVNGLCSEDTVYGEVDVDGTAIKFLAQPGKVAYEGERLHGFDALIPMVMLRLKNNNVSDEFYEAFKRVNEDFQEYEFAEVESVLKACDSFYYEYAKSADEFEILEDELNLDSIKRSVQTGLLTTMASFETIPDTPAMSIAVITKKAREAKKKAIENTYANIKEGSAFIPYTWAEDQKKNILDRVSTLEYYVPNKLYYSMLNKITYRLNRVMMRLDAGLTGTEAIGYDYVNILAVGRPGTGKTVGIRAIAAATGMPVYSITIGKNTEEDTFQGKLTFDEKGQFCHVPTDFLKAYTQGGIIILEEINLADAAVTMGALGQAIESPFILETSECTQVHRHPMCVIVGTMNTGTYGSKELNQALASRFRQVYIWDDPKKEDFINTLLLRNPDKSIVTWVYNAYEKLVQYLKSPSVNADDICLNLTMRACIGALENIEEGDDPKEALKHSMIGQIALADLDLSIQGYNDVIRSLPDLY